MMLSRLTYMNGWMRCSSAPCVHGRGEAQCLVWMMSDEMIVWMMSDEMRLNTLTLNPPRLSRVVALSLLLLLLLLLASSSYHYDYYHYYDLLCYLDLLECVARSFVVIIIVIVIIISIIIISL